MLSDEKLILTEETKESDTTSNKEKLTFKKIVLNVLKLIWIDMVKFPVYIMLHPIKGWEEFKRYKKAKMSAALLFILFVAIVSLVNSYASSFIVNPNKPSNINFLTTLLLYVVIIGVLTICNWATTTFLDGKGKMKEIFMMFSYCLFPLIWSLLLGFIISQFVTLDQIALHALILSAGSILTFYMGILGMLVIHEYGLVKTAFSVLVTALAIVIVAFAGMLVFDLIQKMTGFINTIYSEIILRYLWVKL